jgi:PEGA domain
MKSSLVGTVLVVFAATTAFAGHSGGRASGGSRGGHSGGHAVARSSGARPHGSGGYRSGGYGGGGYRSGGYGRGGAVPRGYASGLSGAQRRQPRPGGYGYGHGYNGHGGHGNGYYGHGHYGRGYYGHGYYGHRYYGYGYPYYGYYGSYPWFSLGVYYGGSYGYASPYYAPAYGYGYSYPAGDSYPAEPPANEDSTLATGDVRREDGRAKGDLRLDVSPDDASVYLDDRFLGSARELRTLALPLGPHRVEVVRPGFQTVERTVQVRSDERATLVVELTRQ